MVINSHYYVNSWDTKWNIWNKSYFELRIQHMKADTILAVEWTIIQPKTWFRRRTFHETNLIPIIRLTQIIKMAWIDSDTDLNCSWTKFKTPKMLILVKLLTKYVIIIYALGSVHEKFSIWIKAIPKLLQRRNFGWAREKEQVSHSKLKQASLIWFRCQTFHVLNSK